METDNKVEVKPVDLHKIFRYINKTYITMSYGDLLRRTEWYNKRDAIKKRDENKCIYCDCEDLLEVHHLYYYYEKTDPWDYPDDALVTVCWKCHELLHEIYGSPKKHKPKLTYDVSDL